MTATDASLSPAIPGRTAIGWIGLGVMGASMCRHLMDAGFAMTVYTRTRASAAPHLAAGAAWADTPAEVAARSDVVFTMVGFPNDVREVILGDSGVLAGCAPAAIIADMTTSEPTLAVEIAARAAAKSATAIDAPVSGGDVGAREARLSIMAGGDADTVRALDACWNAMGNTIVHQGGPGSGQHTKMVNQILIASTMIGVCEGLLYAHRAGLDLETVLRSVSAGSAGSMLLANLAPRILRRDFAPGFYVDHFVKDMGIALAEAERMQLALPGLALAKQLYTALQAHGHGRSGTQALHLALANLSNIQW
jgi:3-hydroxyisobutyrate dehydrogenase